MSDSCMRRILGTWLPLAAIAASSAAQADLAASSSPSPHPHAGASIYLYDYTGTNHCTIDITRSVIGVMSLWRDSERCSSYWDNGARQIRMDNLPAGSVITLYRQRTCGDTQDVIRLTITADNHGSSYTLGPYKFANFTRDQASLPLAGETQNGDAKGTMKVISRHRATFDYFYCLTYQIP